MSIKPIRRRNREETVESVNAGEKRKNAEKSGDGVEKNDKVRKKIQEGERQK